MSGGPSRRETLFGLLAGAVLSSCKGADTAPTPGRTVLLPTAGELDTFLDKCIRCFRCGEVCTAGCISFHSPWSDPRIAGTPYIEPRKVSCNTCMACTQVCPSGALTPVPREDVQAVLDKVDMGTAYIDEGLCLSFLGRVCGVCHDACPFPGDAIRLAPGAKPEVQADCVGCGRCEERCPQVPSAIRVFSHTPSSRWKGPEVS